MAAAVPGGMRSANELWENMPWNPRAALSGDYRVIGMDQRNAGRSTAPVTADDGTFVADLAISEGRIAAIGAQGEVRLESQLHRGQT